jgi:prepilin-type processing-associated H-X9-DG protein
MGMGALAVEARTAASLGALAAVAPDFQAALDVPNGGVLCALPALLAVGLLDSAERFFTLPKGYYGLDTLLLLLAFMALARLKTVESLRRYAPGEWGKLLGLDRVPEVRTLRQKIGLLARGGEPMQWSAGLCRQWMAAAPEQAGVLYLDGHVRVYHGRQTLLPRHHVARQKLCLRATVDYWVNAMDGQPFFAVNQAVDPGLIQVLEHDVLPRLLRDVPGQPDARALADDPLLHRFVMVFDREGYSPDLMQRMKGQRVACLGYHKYPGADWAEDEFQTRQVKLANGQTSDMRLAERGTCLSNGLWVREFRKLTERGHQTAILATEYRSDAAPLAGAMFARWSQENFFKYSRQHYNIDRLADYSTEDIPDTQKVVNPAHRRLDGQVKSATGKLNRLLAQFGAMSLDGTIEPEKVEPFMQKKAALQEAADLLRNEVETAKAARKDTPKHITMGELPEAEKFKQLGTQSKHLVDTVKMIAYRTETAMANILREQDQMARPDEARSLLQALYQTEADILPDHEAGTLTVHLHHSANASTDAVIQKLCDELNETETLFPRTNLRLILKMGYS